MNPTTESISKPQTRSWWQRVFSRSTPDAQLESPAKSHCDTKGCSPQTAKPGPKVLLVDDDTLFLKKTTTRLEAEGYQVVTAENGADAMTLVRKQKPTIAVLDVNLPQDFSGVPWDGYRLTSWLRRFEEWKSIPVVVTSAGDPTQCTRAALTAGATAFYHKRSNPDHLVTLVKQALARKQPAKNTDTKGAAPQ